jgi:pilus assembly protein CpaF
MTMSKELARAQLVGPIMEGLLSEIDFARLQPGHLPRVEALCRQRLGDEATSAIRRQLGGDRALDLLAKDLAEELLCTRVFFALLQDDTVTALLAVGADRLEVERAGRRETVDSGFPSEESLQRVALWMTARSGSPAHAAEPMVRTRLPDGTDLQVILPPLSMSGCVLSLRRPAPGLGDLAGLALNGVVPSALVPVLHAMVSARLTTIVAGAGDDLRGAVVDALLTAVPDSERLVLLDADDASPERRGAVRLQTQRGGSRTELLRAAARMRPDRLVVRRLDADMSLAFLQMAAGSAEGSLATLDAYSPRDALDRLTAQAAQSLGAAAAARLLPAAISAVLFLGRREDGRPVLEALCEVAPGDGGTVLLHDLVRFHARPDGSGTFVGSGTRPGFAALLERRGHRLPPSTWRLQQSVA